MDHVGVFDPVQKKLQILSSRLEWLEQLAERQAMAMEEDPFLKAADNYPVKKAGQPSDKEN